MLTTRVADPPGFATVTPRPGSGEDQRIVGLGYPVGAALLNDRMERAAGGDQRPSLGRVNQVAREGLSLEVGLDSSAPRRATLRSINRPPQSLAFGGAGGGAEQRPERLPRRVGFERGRRSRRGER